MLRKTLTQITTLYNKKSILELNLVHESTPVSQEPEPESIAGTGSEKVQAMFF